MRVKQSLAFGTNSNKKLTYLKHKSPTMQDR